MYCKLNFSLYDKLDLLPQSGYKSLCQQILCLDTVHLSKRSTLSICNRVNLFAQIGVAINT